MPSVVDIKAAVRARDGFRCTGCGMINDAHLARYERQLDVHRVDPGSVYTAEGCITVCRRCHANQPRRAPGVPERGKNGRESFYVDIDPDLVQRMRRLAEHRNRKLNGETTMALRYWLDREEKKEGLLPIEEGK